MTQALNLANFANNLNTSGATSNTGLQNSAVTVTAGTGMSGGGAVALGSSVTLTNAGVTSVAAGTGISVSASTGGITITNTSPGGGGVTSAVAGNGVAVSGATGAVTFSASCPTYNTVGSYASGSLSIITGTLTVGTTYSAASAGVVSGSGTWRCMGTSGVYYNFSPGNYGCSIPPSLSVAGYYYLMCRTV